MQPIHTSGNNKKQKRKQPYGLFTTILLTATIGVAGCGANTNTSDPPSADKSSNSNTATDQTPSTITYPLTVTDQANHKVTLTNKPQHIASLTLGTDEILSALVPKQNIAMMTTWATDPTESNILDFAKGIPQIKDANAEQIIAVHPDLALMATYTKAGIVDQLKQANLPTYEFANFNSLHDIEKNIEVIGQLVGNSDKAKQMVDTLEQQVKQVKDAVQGQKPVTVLNYSSFGFAAGNSTTVNEMIVDAGGKNAAAGLNGWQKITDEQIVKLNPDVIIFAKSEQGFEQKLLNDQALQSVQAIKNKRIYGIPDADLTSVSQYFIKGIQDVAHVLYPSVKLGQ